MSNSDLGILQNVVNVKIWPIYDCCVLRITFCKEQWIIWNSFDWNAIEVSESF